MDTTQRVIASLNYFSIFFAPFLFPIIVYFVTTNESVKYHAKRALLSHIIPVLVMIGSIVTGIILVFSNFAGVAAGTIALGYLAAGILYFIFMIWNIVQGIKLFT